MSHYFSHVRLLRSTDHVGALREGMPGGDAYRDHALIWRLFPGDGVQRDFVFRRLKDQSAFYVVSARPPDASSGLFDIKTKKYRPELQKGEWVRFDLRANPVVSRRSGEGRSTRHDVLMDLRYRSQSGGGGDATDMTGAIEQAGMAWLLQRAASWGMEVLESSVIQSAYVQHNLTRKRGAGAKQKPIRFSSLDYQGVARVADPDLLRNALLNGVGHAKGFGCGLLLVRRQG